MTRRATALRLAAKAADLAALMLPVAEVALPPLGPEDVLVEVKAAGVNASDVKAALGAMPYAVFPRTPGRDFAGVIVDGPAEAIGQRVFGSSGDLGIRRDGTHATHLVVERAAVAPIPPAMGFAEAAGIGVPFVTASTGFARAGAPKPGDVVLVMGVNGKVGQAAAQIASRAGARVIGAVRRAEPYEGHATAPVDVVSGTAADIAARVREITGGHGADIVFNTVGDPYFEAAHKSLALDGRQVLIAAINRIVEFNIFEFYRGRHSYFGIDTLSLSSVASGQALRALVPGFADGTLRPYPIADGACYPLVEARAAYAAVMASARDRVILIPDQA
jgi:NADPH:quinone reductase-like Zn-dependent oxidoreductase